MGFDVEVVCTFRRREQKRAYVLAREDMPEREFIERVLAQLDADQLRDLVSLSCVQFCDRPQQCLAYIKRRCTTRDGYGKYSHDDLRGLLRDQPSYSSSYCCGSSSPSPPPSNSASPMVSLSSSRS